jgi:hypothetical protein
MKRLMIDAHKIVFNITKAAFFSFFVALLYITVLNVISIYGSAILLQGWVVPAKVVKRISTTPFYIAISLFILLLNYRGLKTIDLAKERKKEVFYPPILIYSVMSVILFLYIYYKDKLF